MRCDIGSWGGRCLIREMSRGRGPRGGPPLPEGVDVDSSLTKLKEETLSAKSTIRALSVGLLALLVLSVSPAIALTVYDLASAWSDATNPNGPWSYADGLGPIAVHQTNWTGNSPGFPNPQPAWALATSGPGHIPVWFKSVNTAFDFLPGDVITHTWDGFNGLPGRAPSLLVWASPFDAEVDLSGDVWLARHIGRDVSFSLLINGIATGIQDSSLADTSRASKDTFVLNDILMNAGDTITLRFDTVSSAGDFIGVNLSIAATPLAAPVPEPSTIFLLTFGLAAVFRLSSPWWKSRSSTSARDSP